MKAINRRLRALVFAHEFSPKQGSECAEGWNIVTRLAAYHDVTVLYARRNHFATSNYQNDVQEYFRVNGEIPGLTCIAVDQPSPASLIARINRLFSPVGPIGLPILYYPAYRLWQRKAYKIARQKHKAENFEIAHQLTQITFREPGYGWKLGIPFIWGPTGGTSTMPAAYFSLLSPLSGILERIRSFSTYFQSRFVARIRKAAENASIIYAFSPEDAGYFRKKSKGTIRLMMDAGTYAVSKQSDIEKPGPGSAIKGVWCGQLTDRKAPIILIKALKVLNQRSRNVFMTIIGDGPIRGTMQSEASKLGIDTISWIDKVSHEEVFNIMADSDFLIHTSLREASTNVIPEALSAGLPVICHDINGMSLAINETCGIKVEMKSPEKSYLGFSEAMQRLADDEDYLQKLKMGARSRAGEISWDKMAEIMSSDYLQITSSGSK